MWFLRENLGPLYPKHKCLLYTWERGNYSKLILPQKRKAPDQTSLRKQVFTEELAALEKLNNHVAAPHKVPQRRPMALHRKRCSLAYVYPKALPPNVKHPPGSSENTSMFSANRPLEYTQRMEVSVVQTFKDPSTWTLLFLFAQDSSCFLLHLSLFSQMATS